MDIDVNMSRKCNGAGSHDQIIHFSSGKKRLIQGVVAIWEQGWVHIVDYLGVEYIVNPENVDFIERFSKGEQKDGSESVRHTSNEQKSTRSRKRPSK